VKKEILEEFKSKEKIPQEKFIGTNIYEEIGERGKTKIEKGNNVSPTRNTFLENVHTAGELGAHKMIQIAYLWVLEMNATVIQKEVYIFHFQYFINC